MRNVTHMRPFCTSDLRAIQQRSEGLVLSQSALDLQITTSMGNVHTFLVADIPAAIVAASFMWSGVWQVWAILSDLIRGHGISFTKSCEIILTESAKAFKVRRYNAVVDGTKPEYIRWIALLKFKYEFTMYDALPGGGDVHGYVRWEGR